MKEKDRLLLTTLLIFITANITRIWSRTVYTHGSESVVTPNLLERTGVRTHRYRSTCLDNDHLLRTEWVLMVYRTVVEPGLFESRLRRPSCLHPDIGGLPNRDTRSE